MKCPSDCSAGRDPWAPPPASGGGGSSEPAKKRQRTSSSSQAEASSSSQPPPQPPGDAREVPDLGEDVIFEVLRRVEARTLAAAACVSRGWRILALDERLWEAACLREWADLGFSEQLLRDVVLLFGGFRRLHAASIQARQRFGGGCGKWHGVRTPGQERRKGVPWTEDERLWEAACLREWADLGFSEQLLRDVVLSFGGFRRLHAASIQARQRFGGGCGKWHGGRTPEQERRKGVPWTDDEHKLFLLGLMNYGKGDWRNISRNFVQTRTPTQVASHAQKYFIRLSSGVARKSSIHDITTVHLTDDQPPSPSQ